METVLSWEAVRSSMYQPSRWTISSLPADLCRNWSRLTWRVASTRSYVAAQTFLRVRSHLSSLKFTIGRQQNKFLLGWRNTDTAQGGTLHQKVSRDICSLGRQGMTAPGGCGVAQTLESGGRPRNRTGNPLLKRQML